MRNPYIVTKEDIEDTFQIICKYSVHSFMDDIKKGFITLRGGHRIGIVGKVIIENGQVKNIVNFVEDKINGVSKIYYDNGQLEGEYTFVDNQFDGLFRKYSRDGKITNEAIFKNGKVEKIIK